MTGVTDGAFVVDLTSGGSTVGHAATQVVPVTASKTWLGYRVALSGAATNLVGVPHTFTATVEQSADGTTWSPVPDGSTLTATTAGPGAIDTAASTCATGGTTGGTCTYVVTDAGPGTLTLTVTEIAGTTIDGAPATNLPVPPVDTSKTWLAYTVTVSPSASNPVGVPHVFTITATRTDGTTTVPVANAPIVYTWTGTGTATPPSSCTTDTAGVCTVTVTSATPGTGTLTVISVTDGAFVVDLTVPGAPGQAASQVVPLTSSKTWLMPTIAIEKTSTATQIVPGSQVPYTLTVTNTGPVRATDVVVTDVLPVGLSFVSSVPPSCTASGQAVTCNMGTLATGANTTIELTTQAADPFPPDAVDPSGQVINTATVSSPTTNCPPGGPLAPECDSDFPLPVLPTVATDASAARRAVDGPLRR